MGFLRWLLGLFRPNPVFTLSDEISFDEALTRKAMSQLGKGETAGNNQGPDVVEYRQGKSGRGSWCAAFVSWCIEETARDLGIDSPVARSHGARRLFKNAVAAGQRRETPDRGMLALWNRGAPGGWQAHIGIVRRAEPDGTFYCIEGNRGRYPAKVGIFKHQLGEARLVGFVRIGRAAAP